MAEITKSKRQLKQEAKEAKRQQKFTLATNAKIRKLEHKKEVCQNALNKAANPKDRQALKKHIEKLEIKIADLKDPTKNRPTRVVVRTWSKGLRKEAGRITWEKKEQVIKDFVIIFVVCVILAIVFFALDMILITIRK